MSRSKRSSSSLPFCWRVPNFIRLYCEIVAYLLWFVVLIFFCVMFTAFYRKYYVRSPFLMVFLSVVLPARGFTIFAVRNNRAVDYNEYLRRRMEAYSRRNDPYGPSGGPYSGPYSGPYRGPYGGQDGGAGSNPGADGEPFSDFGDRPQGGQDGQGGQGGTTGGGDDNPFSDF